MKSDCVIAGGGPAGMMMGFLLARAGVDVVVLEKHADFLRDFRGDTIHPSTLDVMHELGLLDEFLRRPHDELRDVAVRVGSEQAQIADFRHVPTHCKFLMMMPQWEFLDFLAGHARKLPDFHLVMQAEARTLVEENGRVAGLRGATPEGELRGARGAGGRRRRPPLDDPRAGRPAAAGLRRAHGRAVDARLAPPRRPARPVRPGRRRPHAGDDRPQRLLAMRAADPQGLVRRGARRAAWRRCTSRSLGLSPWLGERVRELVDWDQVKLLAVTVDRLRDWSRPGLLCIGDAAHAMSPIGGVGINLAVQDAVAAARLLAAAAARAPVEPGRPAARSAPPRVAGARGAAHAAHDAGPADRAHPGQPGRGAHAGVPAPGRPHPMLRRIPAWFIGVGVRPEHVDR